MTVRDYDREERGTGLVKPYGVRDRDGKRYVIFQVWDFRGDIYDLAMYFVVDDGGGKPETHVMRSKYYAIGTDRLHGTDAAGGFRLGRAAGREVLPAGPRGHKGKVKRPVEGGIDVHTCGDKGFRQGRVGARYGSQGSPVGGRGGLGGDDVRGSR